MLTMLGYLERRTTAIFAFLILLLLTAGIYWQGLDSPFIFDDVPNLSPMGKYQYLGFWHDVGLFLLQGDSGPTGRPISLASFYLNANAWESASAFNFKLTNAAIHLINGILIFWLSLRLTRLIILPDTFRVWCSLATTAIWLLHPIQINTVLFVIQRMTELSTLFTLIGLHSYLYARQPIADSKYSGALWLILGMGGSLLLALLSKENGILLVVYVLVIEYFLLRPFHGSVSPRMTRSLWLMAWLPFFLLLAYLLMTGWQHSASTARAFSVMERLLSESRVLWSYLGQIFLPSLQGTSLFHDDFQISRGLFAPVTTFLAVLGIFMLLGVMVFMRRSQPVLAFAIAWFLGGHLLESTTILLELYFEHRNYLPLYGIAFAIVYYVAISLQRFNKLRGILLASLSLYTVLLAGITLHSAQQWADPLNMVIGWLEQHPRSQRTLETLDVLIGEHINPNTRQQLLKELEQAGQQQNTSSYLKLKPLLQACQAGTLTPAQLNQTLVALPNSGFVASAPKVYADLVDQWLTNQCGHVEATDMLNFSKALLAIPDLQQGDMPYLLHYWQAQIQVKQGNLDATIQHLETAYAMKPDIDNLLLQASYLSSAGLYPAARDKIETAPSTLCTTWRQCWIVALRQQDLDNMTSVLAKQLQK